MSFSPSKRPGAVPCYGRCQDTGCRDYNCEYRESCKIYNLSEKSTLLPKKADVKLKQADEETVYAALTHLFMWMLSVDSYTLRLIQQILIGKKESISEIAAEMNISRQAVHKKMLDTIVKHPELCLLFQTVITKITKTETYFVKKSKERKKEK